MIIHMKNNLQYFIFSFFLPFPSPLFPSALISSSSDLHWVSLHTHKLCLQHSYCTASIFFFCLLSIPSCWEEMHECLVVMVVAVGRFKNCARQWWGEEVSRKEEEEEGGEEDGCGCGIRVLLHSSGACHHALHSSHWAEAVSHPHCPCQVFFPLNPNFVYALNWCEAPICTAHTPCVRLSVTLTTLALGNFFFLVAVVLGGSVGGALGVIFSWSRTWRWTCHWNHRILSVLKGDMICFENWSIDEGWEGAPSLCCWIVCTSPLVEIWLNWALQRKRQHFFPSLTRRLFFLWRFQWPPWI